MFVKTRLTIGILMSTAAIAAHAQSRGPAAQYWIDLSTSNMSIPGMSGGSGLFGGMLGGALGGARSKTMETELYVRANPAGVEGLHTIPSGMSMGESLPLMPIKAVQSGRADSTHSGGDHEKPKGRILVYWGCGETVRPGQPKVLDLAKQNYGEFAQFFASRGNVSKGVQRKPGDAYWPNERDSKQVPDDASMQGEQAVSGDGVPASLKFSVPPANDFLPKVQLSTRGTPRDSIKAEWQSMQNAKGYFLHAQGAAKSGDGGNDMIFWSSSEKPDMGWSLMTYLSPSQIASFLQQKVVLQPGTTTCAIPKGIFEKAEGAMLNAIAYGPELNVAHPPRPEKAPAGWQPEWTARVRVKSTGMTMLGMEGNAGGNRGGDDSGDNSGANVPGPLNILKGIFGR